MVTARLLRIATTALLTTITSAQTWSSCNPLYSSSCPEDTALGMSIHVDFTKGAVNSFVASGGAPTYDSSGAKFTVAKSGDAPQLTSLFYIMFGRVEFTMKSAPGAGIVSSLVLQSDDLDEIDMEWLGADDTEVQTNYFGKGQTTTYNRGQFNPAANNQGEYITYTIDWTADRIVWSVGGTVVRTLSYNDADGQYPQTPMQVKFGSWSGGDPANPPGTISWARGPTDYSKGPFSMYVKSLVVTDYSTGKSYRYGDTTGTWQSIVAVDGKVNGNVGNAGIQTVTATAAAATGTAGQSAPTVPVGGIGKGDTATQTGWPWVSTGTATANAAVPSGWRITPEGKIVPIVTDAAGCVRAPHWALLVAPAGLGLLAAVAGRW
ncbi:Concanavalin A-like lectin/glucanase [Coniochaeta hoffmannii]|uniref:chitinase n=1 Tax=Coniochaeta hoffmannii TaxID=91930 RepID=A0AA38S078_9PEZI|nr:Concanavalin A-like lectin/glucanase [Coniochaeta hoffmannii]